MGRWTRLCGGLEGEKAEAGRRQKGLLKFSGRSDEGLGPAVATEVDETFE